MSHIAPHYLHVYQRPRQGTAHVASYKVNGYRHRLVTQGGYDSASCALDVRAAEAEWIYSHLIGCVARFHVDDPMQEIFEGYIDRITYRVGGFTYTKSLENMANKVNVTYFNSDSAAAVKTENVDTATGTVLQNTESQAIYGLKEMNLEAGVHHNNADKTHKILLRQTTLAIRGWPQVSVAYGGENSGALIELEFRGLHVMAWDWQHYNAPKGSAADVTLDLVTAFLRLVGDSGFAGGIYLPSNAASIYQTGVLAGGANWLRFVKSGAGPANISMASASGQTYLQFVQSITEAGDGVSQAVFGLKRYEISSGLRYAYYQLASTTVRYNINALRDTGRIRDIYGRIVPGWMVVPDGVFQTMDIRLASHSGGDDPRTGYISAVEYDADSGTASIQSGDNITLEGVLQHDRYFKAHSRKAFSAPPRQVL
jgi:phosphotransferase system IIB component